MPKKIELTLVQEHTMELLMKFLRKERIVSLFQKNIKKGRACTSIKHICSIERNNWIIISAFSWTDSEQSFSYWYKIQNKWQLFLTTAYRRRFHETKINN